MFSNQLFFHLYPFAVSVSEWIAYFLNGKQENGLPQSVLLILYVEPEIVKSQAVFKIHIHIELL